ncbi:MAG TPA: sugar phosphate nucleotidyltransferase, partial [Acidobacteriota bacterium]|nr:sugar phosphate nucleotidyltransferase [Acidobacteriota bacterium]
KQYCAFVGTRSMLKHTLDRSARLVAPSRIITVIGSGHKNYIDATENSNIPGRIIEQPRSMETAPGVFFPLTYAIASDPDATVFIFPSDHYIFSEEAFVRATRQLGYRAEETSSVLFLFGALPDGPETDYGWIEPGTSLPGSGDDPPRRIVAFHEKPSPQEAAAYYRKGYLWNTMIMAGKARLLWELGCEHLPNMMKSFEKLRQILSKRQTEKAEERHLVSSIYERMEVANFSQTILEKATGRLAVVPLRNVEWSDWGRPSRVVETLSRTPVRIRRLAGFTIGTSLIQDYGF